MRKLHFLCRNMIPVIFKSVCAYVLCAFGYCKSYDDVWIIVERGTDARDNGFFFFQYMTDKHPNIKCCYIIERKSADYPKVAVLGEIIEYGSLKHYTLLFRAKCLISSHIMGFSPNPECFLILEKKKLLILPGKKIFLQHGITKEDIDGLKYPNIKPDVFICGALAEYNFVRDRFGHPDGVVKYTGLARYDTLTDENLDNQILLMPTWRKWLNSYSYEAFAQSDYCCTYFQLLSDPEVHNWLRKNCLHLVFYPHYEMQKFIELFASLESDVIHIARFQESDVQALLKQSSLLITDYSSVYFDFSFLKKPILLYQFDQLLFRSNHYKKGYFDETSIGDVVLTHTDLKQKLFSSYDGKSFSNPYRDAQMAFFGDLRDGCCERIYRDIMQLIGEKYD